MVQAWKNSDNLYLKFGTDKATALLGGENPTVGQIREVEFTITLASLTETETPLSDVVMIPAGVRITEVEVFTQTAGATGVAIDVGLIKNSDRSTEVDYDGLLAAAPIAMHNADGERTIYTASTTVPASATGTGALIGTTTAYTSLVTASRTTATAYTAGVIKVKIRFYKP